MKNKNQQIVRIFLSIAFAFAIAGNVYAREFLIKQNTPLSSNAIADSENNKLSYLVDGDITTYWSSNYEGEGITTDEHYIEVDLGEDITLGKDEDLVIFTQRHGDNALGPIMGPTTFKVEVSKDGVSWVPFRDPSTHVYFLYRGYNTKEYSARITTTKTFRYIRFTVTANNSRTYDSHGIRSMAMSEFQIIKLKRDEDYSDILRDRLRLKTDYMDGYKDVKFENTQGVLDSRNRGSGASVPEDWTDWTGWSNGKWMKDMDDLKNAGIEMPDMSFITSEDDPDVANGQQRQRTHVTEHILYAMPGDAIALYPYYDLATASQYQEVYSHWYDYKTGGRLKHEDEDLLDFLINPAKIGRSDNYGYFAGSSMPLLYKEVIIASAADFNSFAQKVNAGESNLSAKVIADLDFEDGITIVGTADKPYNGVFDGGGHTFKNITVNIPADGVGVFNSVNGGRICNIIVDESCTITGSQRVGFIGMLPNNRVSTIYIEGIVNKGTVVATDKEAGGILGCSYSEGNLPVVMNACGFTGTVKSQNGNVSALSGYLGNCNGSILSNCWSIGTIEGTPNGSAFARRGGGITVTNCYDKNDPNDGFVNRIEVDNINTDEFVEKLNSGGKYWKINTDGTANYPIPNVNPENPIENSSMLTISDRYYGTVGTFFYPRDPYAEDGEHTNLPMPAESTEYVIAADFSQTYSSSRNLVVTKKDGTDETTIVEPVINFRHIFRIRDGKAFADEFSGTPENNKEYIQKNLRHVSAREDADFQIRLDSPVPMVNSGIRSKWYYKISPTDYRRVCSSKIRVLNSDTGKEIDGGMFEFTETFPGQGSRSIDGVDYNLCGGGGSYYRMLHCPAAKAKAGRYTVQLIGLDYNGKEIKICGTEEPLIVQEFRITFLPSAKAKMLTANDADTKTTEEFLENLSDEGPRAKVDFDEYRKLNGNVDYTSGSGDKYRFKWPVPWDQSNYAFTYNPGGDFSVYRLATHSSLTPYAVAANKHDGEKGLYDRLYYKTGGEPGYFYYVNAASDPGIMARMKINELCSGSTLHVSAWVSEFSEAEEAANIAFNFVAVKKNTGERVPLHTFTSGYVPRQNLGEWMYIYYSFVPSFTDMGITTDDIDHYELELDNNCKSSQGADYAIDDIRVYVTRPVVYARQTTPICEKGSSADVKIETPFDVLLQSIALAPATNEEEAQTVNIYYTFLDKEIFDKVVSEYQGADVGIKAFESAQLKYKYDLTKEDKEQTFGHLTFSSFYGSEKNKKYKNETETPDINIAMTQDIQGVQNIVFNTRPKHDGLLSGKEYIIALYTDSDDAIQNPGATAFDVSSDCAKTCVFTVQASLEIKIDGVVVPDANAISCCENQQPVVQVDLYGKDSTDDKKLKPLDKNAYFDWYTGSRDEYDNEIGPDNLPLSEVMAKFRYEYPDAGSAEVEPTENFTEGMRDYLLSLTLPHDDVAPKILLYSSSYVFPPVKMEEGQTESYVHVLAIPITTLYDETKWKVCAEPTDVRIRITRHAPDLAHGLNLNYPEYLNDVPLRIGLKQVRDVSVEASGYESAVKTLNIPIRSVASTAEYVQYMKVAENRYVYLAETNDPEYKNLHSAGEADDQGLKAVGYLKELVASKAPGSKNIIKVAFDKSFNFKESYYYRFIFGYSEESSGGTSDPNDVPCDGEHVFTLKIVPEYVMWTGKAGTLNWNNDRNWRRVTSSELYWNNLPNTDARKDGNEFTTDGSQYVNAYAPLDFTKVIISGDVSEATGVAAEDADGTAKVATFPYLYTAKKTTNVTVNGVAYSWPDDPEDGDSSSPAGKPEGLLDLIKGGVTHEVQYDMTSLKSETEGINCRPWYMNTCEQIHFKPNSQIRNQQHLVYEKAWVDLEISPSRWYTLASPLQGVVAGDLYLPSNNARQETAMFEPIKFSLGEYNRFKPAVFQRSWNKATANVYELKDLAGGPRNVAVATTWSNVFNDVKEQYGSGNGFSIKADVSEVGSVVDKVLFRLPKADTFYEYYNKDGSESGDYTTIARPEDNYYKLNSTKGTIEVGAAKASKYFLVGNPFMSHLDLVKFIERNSDVIYGKYWIMSENNQTAGVMSNGTLVTTNGVAALAPLQGFFVEAKNEAVSITLKYDESMMSDKGFGGDNDGLRLMSRSGADGNVLVISATASDGSTSKALINVQSTAKKEYDSSEDVMLLNNPDMDYRTLVYTVADGKATTINTLPDVNGTEIGLETLSDDGAVLSFENVDCVYGYMLYDTETKEYTPIYEGMEYGIRSGYNGRLFITAGETDDEIESLQLLVNSNELVARTVRNSLQLNVFDTLGRKVWDVSENSNEVRVTLESGIYVIEARDEEEKIVRKIIIK